VSVEKPTIRVLYITVDSCTQDRVTSLTGTLNATHDLALVSCGGIQDALGLCAALHPDVVLMDVPVPDLNDVRIVQAIRSQNQQTRVLVLSHSDEPHRVRAMLGGGASGYLLRQFDWADLAVSIRAVHSGTVICSSAVIRALTQPRT
jgi:DNA-binding NarL/FixJ family response regulator